MAIATIAMPFIRQEAGSNQPAVMKDGVPEINGTSWLPQTLVYTSGTGVNTVLNPCATGAVLCYGQAPGASKGTNIRPPDHLFGTAVVGANTLAVHFPFDVRDRILEINASHAANFALTGTASGVTWAGGGTGGVALAAGQRYGIMRPTSGTYLNYQFLDVSNVATPLFEIVALAPNQAAGDNNPRLWVKVIPTLIQG